jgi:hypothetical protein
MEIRANKIICYVDYIHKGISLYKDNNLDDKSYLTIDKGAILKMIEHNTDMDIEVLIQYHYGKFTDEQLKSILDRIKEIIKHNDEYKEYRNVKEIYFV